MSREVRASKTCGEDSVRWTKDQLRRRLFRYILQLLADIWITSNHTVEGQEVDMLTFSLPEVRATQTLGGTLPLHTPSPLSLAGAPR